MISEDPALEILSCEKGSENDKVDDPRTCNPSIERGGIILIVVIAKLTMGIYETLFDTW